MFKSQVYYDFVYSMPNVANARRIMSFLRNLGKIKRHNVMIGNLCQR